MPHSLTLTHVSVEIAQERSEKTATEVVAAVKAMEKSPKKPPKRTVNALESARFGDINKKISRKMNATIIQILQRTI